MAKQKLRDDETEEITIELPEPAEPAELDVVYPGPHESVVFRPHGEFVRDVPRPLPREIALDLADRKKVRLV
jgi:hypothetical protein